MASIGKKPTDPGFLFQGTDVAELLKLLIEKIGYEEHLRKSEEFDSRWANVQELVSLIDVSCHFRKD